MKRSLAITRYVVLFSLFTVTSGRAQDSESQTVKEIPERKQTSLGLYLSSIEAYEKWAAEPERVFVLDVRTPEEYIFVGHADMAWNIPLAFQTYDWDSTKQHFAIERNPDFVSLVREQFALEDTLLVMCRSGGRSAAAVNLMAEAGYKYVFNVIEGMEGDHVEDPESVFQGKRLKNGWKNSGLPWTYEIDREKMRLPM